MMWSAAFWAFKCSANTFGSGWPKFTWSFLRSLFSVVLSSRYLGPWIAVVGRCCLLRGTHSSHPTRISPVVRCMQTVCLMVFRSRSGSWRGIWNLSVPRHTQITWTFICGTNCRTCCATAWEASTCKLPTRGAKLSMVRKTSRQSSDSGVGTVFGTEVCKFGLQTSGILTAGKGVILDAGLFGWDLRFQRTGR